MHFSKVTCFIHFKMWFHKTYRNKHLSITISTSNVVCTRPVLQYCSSSLSIYLLIPTRSICSGSPQLSISVQPAFPFNHSSLTFSVWWWDGNDSTSSCPNIDSPTPLYPLLFVCAWKTPCVHSWFHVSYYCMMLSSLLSPWYQIKKKLYWRKENKNHSLLERR